MNSSLRNAVIRCLNSVPFLKWPKQLRRTMIANDLAKILADQIGRYARKVPHTTYQDILYSLEELRHALTEALVTKTVPPSIDQGQYPPVQKPRQLPKKRPFA